MQTIEVQLIGPPHDGKMTKITAYELRNNTPIFVPYVPADAVAHEGMENPEIAMAEYIRVEYGTEAGQLLMWFDPHMQASVGQEIIDDILEGRRTSKGVWIIQGVGSFGRIQLTPLEKLQ